MSFGSPVLRQHVVEFIRGTGVVTDGVTDANYGGGGTNGPWNWVVPAGVASIELGITSGGMGGGGGGDPTGAISVGGGGGGMGGTCWYSYGVSIVPNSTLVVTLGAGGTGGAIGGQGTVGGSTIVDGILGAYSDANSSAPAGGATTGRVIARMMSGGTGSNFGLASPSTFGSGGAGTGGLGGGATAGGTTSGGQGANGLHGNNYPQWWVYPIGTQAAPIHCWPGAGGAAGNASGSVAGGGNQYVSRSFIAGGGNSQEQADNPRGGTGNTTGSLSRGGGGCGGNNLFGYGGRGGDGGVAGGAGIGYGGGGGGGGGGAAGGAGGNGYVRFTYWSID